PRAGPLIWRRCLYRLSCRQMACTITRASGVSILAGSSARAGDRMYLSAWYTLTGTGSWDMPKVCRRPGSGQPRYDRPVRSLLAVILVLACAVAVLSRQFVIAVILAPMAWVAASRAAREPGDME